MNQRDVLLPEQDTTLVPNSYTLLRGFINKAWLGFGSKSPGLGSAKLGQLVRGFITRHPTDFRYRCFAHLSSYTGLAWAGLGSNSLSCRQIRQTKIWCDRPRFDNYYYFLFITAFPVPESPKASGRVRSPPRPLSLSFVWLKAVFRRPTASVGGFEFRVFLLFTCVLVCVDSTQIQYQKIFNKNEFDDGIFFAKLEKYTSSVQSDCRYTINMLSVRQTMVWLVGLFSSCQISLLFQLYSGPGKRAALMSDGFVHKETLFFCTIAPPNAKGVTLGRRVMQYLEERKCLEEEQQSVLF